jgi:hypothetical protein
VDDQTEYSLAGLPSFPIILQPGHIAGDGNLLVKFAPLALGRARSGQLRVTYLSDPITGASTAVTRQLCGEGVNTGARVLVTLNGTPLSVVKKIQLGRINANRNGGPLDTVDVRQDAPLTTITQTSPCSSYQFQREYGGVGNPVLLLPGSYRLDVTIRVNNHTYSKRVGFDLSTCSFNPTITVNFP